MCFQKKHPWPPKRGDKKGRNKTASTSNPCGQIAAGMDPPCGLKKEQGTKGNRPNLRPKTPMTPEAGTPQEIKIFGLSGIMVGKNMKK